MCPVNSALRRRQASASSALAFLFLLTACTGSGASARTLTVGPGREFSTPSAAIASAADGDIVMIDPGQYFDCAVVKASHLTIEGAGPGVVLTDKTCQGKAILVVSSYLPELFGICDRIAVMARGTLSEALPVDQWTEHQVMEVACRG